MLIHFTKMQGLGNDFVVVDGIHQNFQPHADLIKQWANRHTGIGFDQLLLAEKSANPNVDFRYRIFNADGSEVAQCGNGARCLAKFLIDEKLTHKQTIKVETLSGILELKLDSATLATVNLGVPIFEPTQIPFIAKQQAITYDIDVAGETITAAVLSVGNPHCVLLVETIDTARVDELGTLLNQHERFPQHTNVEFLQILTRDTIRLRVYERGVGETNACGSGACAAVIAGRLLNLLDPSVTVNQIGGQLTVNWQDKLSPVYLTGPAISVFKGSIKI